jgi:hypothetical protein
MRKMWPSVVPPTCGKPRGELIPGALLPKVIGMQRRYQFIRRSRVLCGLRRFSAILLLFVFGLSLLSPLFGADAESSLPACCRKAGKHHCAMAGSNDSQNSPSGAGWRSNGRCPSYPGFATGTFPMVAGIAPRLASALALSVERASCSSFELRVLSSLRLRAHSKRGPPVFV